MRRPLLVAAGGTCGRPGFAPVDPRARLVALSCTRIWNRCGINTMAAWPVSSRLHPATVSQSPGLPGAGARARCRGAAHARGRCQGTQRPPAQACWAPPATGSMLSNPPPPAAAGQQRRRCACAAASTSAASTSDGRIDDPMFSIKVVAWAAIPPLARSLRWAGAGDASAAAAPHPPPPPATAHRSPKLTHIAGARAGVRAAPVPGRRGSPAAGAAGRGPARAARQPAHAVGAQRLRQVHAAEAAG